MLKNIRCNLCGADHYEVLYKRTESAIKKKNDQNYLITQARIIPPVRIVKCLKCGLIYVNPREITRDILIKYEEMGDEDYLKEEMGRRISSMVILKKLRRYKRRGNKLLEIGCAAGFFLDEAKKEGWDTYGAEISKWAVNYAKDRFGLNIFCGTLKRANFSEGYFDVIILKDTLEHLTDPKGTLLEIRRILKPEGTLYINTPNIDSLTSRIFKARWWGLNQFHLYYFTRITLSRLLKAAGLKAITWGRYSRTFSLSYWLDKLEGYDKKFEVLRCLTKLAILRNRLIKINAGDQIEVIAKRRRSMIYLPEIEREIEKEKKEKMNVIVVLPAYNAAKTLRQTVKDIPKDIVDEIILVDDASQDNTLDTAKQLGLTVFRHDRNKGYGANQKTCYTNALKRGADIVIMVHPDYQYDPKFIPEMICPIQEGKADAVFGSRMLKGGALEGGMPLWKHNLNITFTAFANVLLGTYLTEYHSGFRAYSAKLLRTVRFMDNANDFVFDTEIIVQILLHYLKIDEVPIRTRYFEEASVITPRAGFWYGVKILKTLFKYILHKHNIIKFIQFE